MKYYAAEQGFSHCMDKWLGHPKVAIIPEAESTWWRLHKLPAFNHLWSPGIKSGYTTIGPVDPLYCRFWQSLTHGSRFPVDSCRICCLSGFNKSGCCAQSDHCYAKLQGNTRSVKYYFDSIDSQRWVYIFKTRFICTNQFRQNTDWCQEI